MRRITILLSLTLPLLLASCVKPRISAKPLSLPQEGMSAGVVAKNSPLLGKLVEAAVLTNVPNLKLVSRAEQKQIAEEKILQLSGDFSDESMVSLGQQLGVRWLLVAEELVVDESFFEQKSRYGMRIDVIDVESGLMLGFAQVNASKEEIAMWGYCDFDCLKEQVTQAAVRRLFAVKKRDS